MSDESQPGRGYDLDELVDVDTVERMKALADPLRMYLCDLVLERAMSVTELAERVDRPKGTVAYHVDQLVDAGLLKVVRTRKVRAVEERFYGRVARTMVFADHRSQALPFLDLVIGDVNPELADELAAESGPTEEADGIGPTYGTYRRARIPPDRAAEYSRRLHALALEFIDEPRDGDIEFGMYVLVHPTIRSARGSTEPTQEADHG
jgi:DNA-binding transcriptional ArsR family regulator